MAVNFQSVRRIKDVASDDAEFRRVALNSRRDEKRIDTCPGCESEESDLYVIGGIS